MASGDITVKITANDEVFKLILDKFEEIDKRLGKLEEEKTLNIHKKGGAE